MAAGGSRAVLGLWLLAAGLCGAAAAGRSPSCHEVRTAFQLRQIGPLKLVPDVPTAGQYRATRGWLRHGRDAGLGAGPGSPQPGSRGGSAPLPLPAPAGAACPRSGSGSGALRARRGLQ